MSAEKENPKPDEKPPLPAKEKPVYWLFQAPTWINHGEHGGSYEAIAKIKGDTKNTKIVVYHKWEMDPNNGRRSAIDQRLSCMGADRASYLHGQIAKCTALLRRRVEELGGECNF